MLMLCVFYNVELGLFLVDVCWIMCMDCVLFMNIGVEVVEIVIKVVCKWVCDVKGLVFEVVEIIVFENNFYGCMMMIVGFFLYD